VQPQNKDGLADAEKKEKELVTRYLTRHFRTAILVLAYHLAVFVLIGALLANNRVDLLQWNWVAQLALTLLIVSGFSWIISNIAVFRLGRERPHKYTTHLTVSYYLSGGLYVISFPAAIVFLIVAIFT